MDNKSIWRAIEEGPDDAFEVQIHGYQHFQVWRRVRRQWWRRLLWAPWRRYRLVNPDTIAPPMLEIHRHLPEDTDAEN